MTAQVEDKTKVTEDIKLYMINYRNQNPDKWTARKLCTDCNYEYSLCGKTSHFRSKNHKYNLLIKENKELKKKKIN